MVATNVVGNVNGTEGGVFLKDGTGTTRVHVDDSALTLNGAEMGMASEGSMTVTAGAAVNVSAGTAYSVTATTEIDLTAAGVVDINGAGGVTLTASDAGGDVLVEALDGTVTVVARGAGRDLSLGSSLSSVLMDSGVDVNIT